ncbi:MAG: hypothetical protein ABIY37_16070 [Devosia sp.]
MFDFVDDFFHFLTPDAPAAAPADEDSNPIEGAAHDVFDLWQDSTGDFFQLLEDAANDWGDPTQNFVSSWRQATEGFADQFAGWFGWSNNDSPV